MTELSEGIDHARSVLRSGLSGQPVAPEPWEEIVQVLDAAFEHAEAGDKRSALERADEASAKLKMLAMMNRGANFELMDMEDARRDALRALDYLPRAI